MTDRTENRELSISRVFNAPQKLVFEAWTQPEHLLHWWGPAGFTNTNVETNIAPGGTWRFIMHGPDGTDYQNRIDFERVDPHSFLSYAHADHDNGKIAFNVTVNFDAAGENKTNVTMRSIFPSAEALRKVVEEFGADKGMIEHMNRLGDQLALMQDDVHVADEFAISRVFDAPIDTMFSLWTDPEHLGRWWGPAGAKLEVERMELKPGGMFLYSMTGPDGNKMYGRFLYREISAPDRMVFTSSFSDAEGNPVQAPFFSSWPLEVLNILTLSNYGSQTALSLRGWPLHATDAEREAFKANREGMNQGFGGTFKQLDDYIAAMHK